MSIQEIRPVLSNTLVVGSSPSESEKILNKYLELDIQAKVIESYYQDHNVINNYLKMFFKVMELNPSSLESSNSKLMQN